MPPYHALLKQWSAVVEQGAPVEDCELLHHYDFFDWLNAFKELEAEHGPLLPKCMLRIQSLLHAYVDSESANSNPNALLLKLMRDTDVWEKAWVVEFLIAECSAGVKPNDSCSFLADLFYRTTPEAVRRVCDHNWNLLLYRGLDVNGVRYNGRENLLSEYMTEPEVVQKALAHGADPFIVNTRDNLDLLDHMQHRMETIYHQDQRANIQQSMALVRAAQNALDPNRARSLRMTRRATARGW
jgi:hypothetical protein